LLPVAAFPFLALTLASLALCANALTLLAALFGFLCTLL